MSKTPKFRVYAKLADELNQCLQIIVTNAGNIKDDRCSAILEECCAIEDAVKRAAAAIRSYEPREQGPRKGKQRAK